MPLAVSQAFVVTSGRRLSHALRIVNITFRLMKLGASDLPFAGALGLRAIGFGTLDFVFICFYRDCVLLGSCRFRFSMAEPSTYFFRIADFSSPVQREKRSEVSGF